jgi:hypothetical protein
MNQLKKAVRDNVQMRRSLGYKLKKAPGWLSDFVSILEEQGARPGAVRRFPGRRA